MPTISDYIKKYRGGKYALTRKEAAIFGIPYPLKKGWAARLCEKVVDQSAVDKAVIVLKRFERKKNRGRPTPIAPLPAPILRVACDVASDSFLSTYEWRKIRLVVLKRDGAKCCCCGATPASGAVMNVDHIKPRKIYPHLALDVNNLQVLCHECNHGKGNWDMTDFRLAYLDSKT